jgi:hypothetical protein
MKRIAKEFLTVTIVLAALCLGFVATAQTYRATTARQQEVLVLTTSTEMPRLAGSKGFEIQNLGPNNIWCNIGQPAVVGTSRRLQTGEFWGVGVAAPVRVYCIASTANQVTTAATIFTEAF